jgi:hypothetical protein
VWRLTSPSSSIYGFDPLLVPRPDLARRRIRVKMLEVKMVFDGFAMTAALLGVGSPDPALGDFPAAMGLDPVQGVKRISGSGAPPTAPVRRLCRVPEGLLCNFVLVLDLSIRTKS